MATLIVEHQGKRRGGVLNGRVLIGRRPGANAVVIDDASVSRIHAWVGRVGRTYFVADGGSRTGTMVNGRPVNGRRTLRDGDEILIGPAKLFFYVAAQLPENIEPLNSGAASADEEGAVVECQCGAPKWVAWDAPEAIRRCAHCGKTVALPARRGQVADHVQPSEATAQPRNPQPRVTVTESSARTEPVESSSSQASCGACQSPIGPDEPTMSCPECGVSFHSNCWIENRGCSSYGCKQVGILDPAGPAGAKPQPPAPQAVEKADDIPPENPRQIQWSYLLLPAAGVAGLGGLFAFGAPSLLLLVGIVVYRLKRPARSQWVFAGAEVFSAVAAAAGAAFSTYWWLLPAAGMVHR